MGVTNYAQSTQIVYALQLIVYYFYFVYYLYTFVMDLQVLAGADIKILTLGVTGVTYGKRLNRMRIPRRLRSIQRWFVPVLQQSIVYK